MTLRDLLDSDLDLSASRLAVLSACQTGIIDFRRIPDEAIGFPAGLLQAGVPGVVSTLWLVDDISTALLLARFYRHHLNRTTRHWDTCVGRHWQNPPFPPFVKGGAQSAGDF